MYDLLYKPPQKLMLLAGCSTVCTTVAEAAKMWNLVVVCIHQRIYNLSEFQAIDNYGIYLFAAILRRQFTGTF